MEDMKYKGYTGSVEFSDEDNCLFGKVQGLKGALISYEGITVDELREDFEGAIDDYLESCKEREIGPTKSYFISQSAGIRKTGLEEALEEVKSGRVSHYESVEDFFEEMGI